MIRSIRAAATVNREHRFLIDGLVSSRLGIVYGEPFAGKSLLTIAMVAALVEGDGEFLGRKVNRQLGRVAFGLTDPDAAGETRARIENLVVDLDRVLYDEIADDGTPGYWHRVADELGEKDVGLFVLDNVLGAMPGCEDIGNRCLRGDSSTAWTRSSRRTCRCCW